MAVVFTAGTSVESTASVTATTVTLPAGLAAGDYTIIVVSLNAATGVITTPAGWTNILASTASVNGSTSDELAIFYRAWQSGDTNPSVTTTSGRVAATPIKVSGADPTTFVDVVGTVQQLASGATTLTATSITPASSVVCWVVNGRNSATTGVFLTPFSAQTQTQIAEASAKATTAANAGHSFMATTSATPGAASASASANPAAATTGAMAITFSLNAAPSTTKPKAQIRLQAVNRASIF